MFKNTMKTTVLLAGLGGLIVAVAGILGGGSSASLMIGLAIALVIVSCARHNSQSRSRHEIDDALDDLFERGHLTKAAASARPSRALCVDGRESQFGTQLARTARQ